MAIKLRIIRACDKWVEGDMPEVDDARAKQLIALYLAERVKAGRPRKKG